MLTGFAITILLAPALVRAFRLWRAGALDFNASRAANDSPADL
jgi:hypothetical protein